ncbi:MAG: hypothetical protein M3227_05740 [Thermoproteota archaeon]|nr:hypothetical protein [Thermoproteota archaeon]
MPSFFEVPQLLLSVLVSTPSLPQSVNGALHCPGVVPACPGEAIHVPLAQILP